MKELYQLLARLQAELGDDVIISLHAGHEGIVFSFQQKGFKWQEGMKAVELKVFVSTNTMDYIRTPMYFEPIIAQYQRQLKIFDAMMER